MKFRLKRAVGVLLFWIGVVFILNEFSGITGYIVMENAKGFGSIFGLIFIIGGLALFLEKSKLELIVEESLQESEEGYKIKDPKGYLIEGGGEVTLEEFEKGLKNQETFSKIYQAYGPSLQETANERSEKAQIAGKFLEVLAKEAETYQEKQKQELEKYISTEEREKLYDTFKEGWEEGPTDEQKKVLEGFGLEYEKIDEGKGKIVYKENKKYATEIVSESDGEKLTNYLEGFVAYVRSNESTKK